jgi:hypothetical protein
VIFDRLDRSIIDSLTAEQAADAVHALLTLTLSIIERRGSEIDREILRLHYHQRLPFSRIAEEIDLAEPRVRQRWYRLISSICAEIREAVRCDGILSVVFRAILEDEHDFRCSILGLLAVVATKGVSAIAAAIASIFPH